ncbi:MAG: copper homeostasis protein CutC [Bacteroidales bacterium]|nr:copper homeostasis protein CutC [Bacteroidales bacterium]
MLLEVCCGNRQSAIHAAEAGAKRIELCRDLHLGGLTPSHEDILFCQERLPLQTFVLIRPRGGDFCYTEEEFDKILSDIAFCRDHGIPGVVIGFLREDLSLDVEKCRQAMQAAGPMRVTFHRAFDRCKDWHIALEQIIDCGFHRILTSGQQPTAPQGADTLAEIVQQARQRITILAGGGVSSENVAELIHRSHVDEVHASCKLTGEVSQPKEIQLIMSKLAN